LSWGSDGRLAALPADVMGMLRWGALLGSEFSARDLAVVSGCSAGELLGVVDTAMRAGVLADTGLRLAFRHGLIRQVPPGWSRS
jgi:hypothetical protein